MKKTSCFLFVSVMGLSGCAHSLMRGSVAMKVNDHEGYVCLGENEVKEGDKVALFRSECRQSGTSHTSGASSPACTKIKIGEGEITKLLNEHYSVVKTPANVALQEGNIVEVIRAR